MANNNQVQTAEGKALTTEEARTPIDAVADNLVRRKAEFLKVLPSHISFEKFQRTIMTACVANPKLIKADRASLFLACLKAASDGLLPDQRDAALVIFNAKADYKDDSGKDVYIDKVQYMPMYAGILKKVRQSKEISSIVAHVVYDIEVQKKLFNYVLGDDERIEHTPYMGAEDRGEIAAAYCIAKLKDGTVVREVMTRQDIDRVRKTSKSGSMSANDVKYYKGTGTAQVGDPKGIWKEWPDEMSRKTVFRRLAKWLPMSTEIKDDVSRVFENDDGFEALENQTPNAPRVDALTGEVTQDAIEDHSNQPDLKDAILQQQIKETPQDEEVIDTREEPAQEQEEKPAAKVEPMPLTKNSKEKLVKQITQAIKLSDTKESVEECWNVDFADDIKKVQAIDPDAYKALQFEYKVKLKSLAEAS